jgi:hypothetical protein
MYLMPETASSLKFTKLKPSQFDEVIAWDTGFDSFFRFLNPLKITKENLLGLIKNEHNLFFTVKKEQAEAAQALIGFTQFHPVHKTAQVTWHNNTYLPLTQNDEIKMLHEFCEMLFKKYQVRKIQFSVLEKTRQDVLAQIGAIPEGHYLKHFYSQGEFQDIASFRLFSDELRAV